METPRKPRADPQRKSGSSVDSEFSATVRRASNSSWSRTIPTNVEKQEYVENGSSHPSPPPLPPKPAFARASAVLKPPPLPPKPASARAPRIADAQPRPTRPAPLPPPSGHFNDAELGSSSDVAFAARSNAVHESSAKSSSHRRMQSSSTKEDTTLLSSSSSSIMVPTTASEHRRATGIPTPFPPPACSLRESGMAKLFAKGKLDSREITSPHSPSIAMSADQLRVPRCSVVDAEKGGAVLEKSRVSTNSDTLTRNENIIPIQCTQYTGSSQGGEVWAVVDFVVSSAHTSSPEWHTAVELLVGLLVNATIASAETGIGILLEVVRRMKKGDNHIRAGIFILLVNIAAQACFAGENWRNVERVAFSVFSRVVEELDAESIETAWNRGTGLIDQREVPTDASKGAFYVWEMAVKCGIVLLGGGRRFGDMTRADVAAYDTHRNWSLHASPTASGPVVSLKALVALGKHIEPDIHPIIERVIVGEGVWRGFRGSCEEEDDTIRVDVDEDRLYTAHGGLQELIGIYVSCRSILTRRRLFALILEVAVTRVRSRASSTGDTDMIVSDEEVNWLYGLLRANDVGDTLIASFRLGPHPGFVMDVLRHVLFEPLSLLGPSAIAESRKRVGALSEIGNDCVYGRPAYDSSLKSPSGYHSLEDKAMAAAREHRAAVIAAHRLLNKRFALGVLIQLESMAKSFSNQYRHNKQQDMLSLVERVEAKVSEIRMQARSSLLRTTRQVWQGLHAVIIPELDGCGVSSRDIIAIIEQVFSLVLMPPPFARILAEAADSEAEALLGGERRVLAHTNVESAELLTSLLRASAICEHARYVSELRQCLIEILGSSQAHAHLAAEFVDDPDAIVAYRARCICSSTQRP